MPQVASVQVVSYYIVARGAAKKMIVKLQTGPSWVVALDDSNTVNRLEGMEAWKEVDRATIPIVNYTGKWGGW